VAYTSFESGRAEVYVRPFPGPGGKWQISSGGGDYVQWCRTGAELLYTAPDQRVMVVPYAVEADSFRAGRPRFWSEGRFATRPRRRSFDLHPDGARIAAAAVRGSEAVVHDRVVFISNFFDELRRLAPAP
jgi:serine/threonine-protein kinase